MDLGLKDKIALVTGASSGLGLAAAMSLAEEGARIIINSRSITNLESAAQKIKNHTGYSPMTIEGDIAVDDVAENIVEKVISEYGSIDILVANAGGPPAGPFLQHTKEAWKKSSELTLFSAINLVRAAIPNMKKRKWGRIIFISSVAIKQPIDGLIISNTLRAGLAGFAKSISNELAIFGITVNTVCPGYTRTERLKELAQSIEESTGQSIQDVYDNWTENIPSGRLGQPEELANMISFLASEKAGYITGDTIQVDGGYIKGTL